MMTLRSNGDNGDERDHREVTLYDDEALELMTHWWGGQNDPLYAIYSMGGRHEAWVFQDAIRNLDSDLRKVQKVGRNKYQLGRGTFSKQEIDELRIIRDALQMSLDDAGVHEAREQLPHHRFYRRPKHDPGSLVMAGPDVVTGALSPDAQLVHSGEHRGIRFEVYHEPNPEGARRQSRHGPSYRGYRRREGANYAAVVYTPYESSTPGQPGGVEAEQIGYGATPEEAADVACKYIDKLVRGYTNSGAHELREARGPRFDDVRTMLLEGLRQRNWMVSAALKTPHATSPDGTVRLWFKSQAVYMNDPGTDPRDFANTHSLSSDMREYKSVDDLLADVERRKQSHARHEQRFGPREARAYVVSDYIAVDPRGRVIGGPYKDYGQAKGEADRAGGYVKFAMEEDYIAIDHSGRKIGGPYKDYGQAKRQADGAGGYVQYVSEAAGREIQYELWLCEDCMIAEVNGDYSGMTDERAAEVSAGLEKLTSEVGWISANWDSETGEGELEFSRIQCDSCGTRLAGRRFRFASFGKEGMSEAKRTRRHRGGPPAGGWTRQNTKISTWFERDRASVVLETLDGKTILEFWDDDVHQAVEDGFLNPKDWHGSAVEYANHLGATAVSEAPNDTPPHVLPPGRAPRALPPGPTPPNPVRRRTRPPRAPFTRRRSV